MQPLPEHPLKLRPLRLDCHLLRLHRPHGGSVRGHQRRGDGHPGVDDHLWAVDSAVHHPDLLGAQGSPGRPASGPGTDRQLPGAVAHPDPTGRQQPADPVLLGRLGAVDIQHLLLGTLFVQIYVSQVFTLIKGGIRNFRQL